jgi:transcription-repair coupling factor (superfamily II helicase)
MLPAGKPARLTGLPGGSKAFFLLGLAKRSRESLVVVTRDDVEAEGLVADLDAWGSLWPGSERPLFLLFPEIDEAARISSLGLWNTRDTWAILVCSKDALDKPAFSPADLRSRTLELRAGRTYPRSSLLEKLAQGGYERTEMVEMEGEMAVRGEVVDLWPPNAEKPWRLLFDGDALESLREFSSGTQRSEAYLDARPLLPFKETKASGKLIDHIPENMTWFWDEVDPDVIASQAGRQAGARLDSSFPAGSGGESIMPGCLDPRPATAGDDGGVVAGDDKEGTVSQVILYSGLPRPDALDAGFYSSPSVSAPGVAGAAAEARRVRSESHPVLFFSHNAGESERLQELLEEHLGSHGTAGMEFLLGPLRAGFFHKPDLLVLTNAEIFGRTRPRPRLPKFKGGGVIQEIQDIKPGHYVVHEHYGIGRYKGLELLRAAGQEAEYLKLEYAKGDRLYVPLTDFKQIQKYSGAEGKSPRLNSIDTAAWERVKERVKENVQELARDLLRVHAARAALPGVAFPPDAHLEEEFAASFLYEETTDQHRSIEAVKQDMESPHPMDRLILGDVGYGKTEVAMRAAFKAVVNSKQVGVLVPTTILAEQHFRTFQERFADYPARIGMLSRFQTAQEEKETLLGMANGTLDIVIGTHRLFQKDVVFKDLGLLIIDEEHRFGVKHKEQLKKMRAHLDVLTMTATPIPRTLSFALSGMRELSIIETPPTGRLPISTFVGPYEDSVIKEAIQKELDRNGQVFYVHNRVQSLNTRLHFLQQLLPGVSIGVVHGQMSGPLIEKVMWEFLHRRHEILLATSIIESGIDIPTVNTLIVEEAEEFGLAQLYQLRGRVGRDRQKAYCYLFYSPSVPLTADARARLEALREFTELGSGYRLAMRDMEIRGAGNLLGQQQHGFIAAVGLDLYSQMLQEEIARLKGEPAPSAARFPNLDLAVHAFLPHEYMPSEELRILFYKKLVSAETSAALEAVKAELEDRFGPPPLEAEMLLEVSALRLTARDLGVAAVIQKPSSLDIQFLQNTPVEPNTLLQLAQERSNIRFRPGPPFTLQAQPVAYESNGPVHYLKDLFARLDK